ncbi:MAG: M14-type cytosolic carboxypeptidase [Pseudomonadota bacterium]
MTSSANAALHISSAFDSGNIQVVDATTPSNIRLRIQKDNQSDFYQWFHFRVTNAAEIPCTLTIENAGSSAYPKGWEDYRAVASYDRETWFRVPTTFENGELKIHHTPGFNTVWYAYFAPYSMERHSDMVASFQGAANTKLTVLGTTLDGQNLDLITIGEPTPDKRACWVIARQHPGETMAEWCVEGLLDRLTDDDDPVARVLKENAVFYVVPNMNPDGSARGHLRTNAAGTNLNRAWSDASLEVSPEVYWVLEKMKETGVDFFLDCHGDENLPYNFIAGGEGASAFTDKLQALLDGYKAALVRANPDFQTEFGYPVDARGSANLAIATNYITETFSCLAMTLEMPFKDNADLPDIDFGWSPERCRKLGASQLDALHAVAKDLR